jgi:hypothetical protein
MTKLSEHFTLEELTFSQEAARLGIDNTPPPEAEVCLTRLCVSLLEPARIILATHYGRDVPLHVDSGFRAPVLNKRIGGATNSAHMFGRAADLVPIGVDIVGAFDVLRAADLPYDQIIFECKAWIHIAIPDSEAEARRQALTATGYPGAWTYRLA